MVQIENRAKRNLPIEMHHICNFVCLCFNKNKNTTSKIGHKHLKIKNILIFLKDYKNMFFKHL